MQEQTKPSNEAGFVSIEILGALAVLTIILSVVYSLWSKELVEMQKRAVAKHFEKVSIAAQEYAEDNLQDLLDDSTTIQRINNDVFWPDNLNRQNAWQQTYAVYSLKSIDDKLQLIILTQGGKTHTTDEPEFGHLVVPSTAAITPISFIPVDEETTLRAAYGAGDENLEAMGISGAKAGHLGNVITIADGSTGGSGGSGGGGDSGGSGGDGGTTTTPDGKVEYVHFERVLWDDLGTVCKDEKLDRGKLYFTNDYRTNMNSYDPQFSGLYLCMYYQGNGLRLMPVLMSQNPYSPSKNPNPEPLSK